MGKRRVMVIGLDCATPQLVFDQFEDRLPNLRKLMASGITGELESTVPPITCPAWMSMVSGKTPGDLGFYGFRNRKDYSYDGMSFALSYSMKDKTVWDILSELNKTNIVIGVPQTFPPKPLNGWLVTSFLTPGIDSQFTYPGSFRDEVFKVTGDYKIDVDDFRSEDRQRVLDEIYDMTEKRFKLARHMLKTRPWDFFMMVEMGVDRIHHGFWQYMDPDHIAYEPKSAFQSAILKYYQYIDEQVGTLLEHADSDTLVLVVSDHGAQPMEGGIALNQWLIDQGYLTLEEYPKAPTPISQLKVDWSRTKAWGFGGYYGRVFLNVEGREPQGIVPLDGYETLRNELISKLESMTDEQGRILGTKVFKPEDVYPEVNNIPPDLIIYFGDLRWRSIGSVGYPGIYRYENDTGPDGANHSQRGIFIMNEGRYFIPTRGFLGLAQGPPKERPPVRLNGLHLMDVAPTILDWLGVSPPPDMRGSVVRPLASPNQVDVAERTDG